MVIIRVIVVAEDLMCVPVSWEAYAQHIFIWSRQRLDLEICLAAGLDGTLKFLFGSTFTWVSRSGLRFNLAEILRAIAAIILLGFYKHWPCPVAVLQQIHRSQQAEYVDSQRLQCRLFVSSWPCRTL